MQRDLVEQALHGDHGAFGELARASAGGLLTLARLILHDDAAAEDATQDALVAAWRHLRGLRDPDRFEPWLRRLLINACHHEARRAQRRHRTEIHVEGLDLPTPDGSVSVADRDLLDRGFRRLDVDQRAVVVLSYYLGLQPAEVAEILGVPAGTVRSRLHRGMQSMRATLDADERAAALREGGPA